MRRARAQGPIIDASCRCCPSMAPARRCSPSPSASSTAPGPTPLVLCPNPFYQIYEGAAYLAGAKPYFVNNLPDENASRPTSRVPEADWQRVQLVYVCSPGNPTGKLLSLDEWKRCSSCRTATAS
jgi:aspartate/methionine/tyrosine aminotransferase